MFVFKKMGEILPEPKPQKHGHLSFYIQHWILPPEPVTVMPILGQYVLVDCTLHTVKPNNYSKPLMQTFTRADTNRVC